MRRTPQVAANDASRLRDDWTAAHAAYHRALLAACPNPRLLAIAESLRDAAELYRQWSVPMAQANCDIAGEHRTLLDAVLAHDTDIATAALAAHIQTTTNILLEQANTEFNNSEPHDQSAAR